MSKLTVTVVGFTTHSKNTLKGFCSVKIEELHLTVNDIGVHSKNGQTWVSLPSRPWIKDGQVVVGADGQPKYFPVVEIDSKEVRDAFSAAVVAALLAHNPRALDCMGAVQ